MVAEFPAYPCNLPEALLSSALRDIDDDKLNCKFNQCYTKWYTSDLLILLINECSFAAGGEGKK